MRCYICDKPYGQEAGWYVCAVCQFDYPNLTEAITSGEVMVVSSSQMNTRRLVIMLKQTEAAKT